LGKVCAGRRTALRCTSAAQQAGRHRARTSHAGHRRIDTVPLPHGGSSFRHIVGVNGSFGDVSDFVNDQQWVEVAPNADSVRAAVLSPKRRANVIVSATSADVAHGTTAAGLTFAKRAIAGARTIS